MPYCPPSCCPPSCVVPSCSSTPYLGIGAQRCGTSTSSSCLGVIPGVMPSCLNQLPPSEIVAQPPPVIMTFPGAVMSASCEPITVGGTSPCAIAGGGNYYGSRGGRNYNCSPCL